MNQIAMMFRESNARMKKIMEGKCSLEQIAAEQREFESQIKLINSVISAYGISSKNKRTIKDFENMGLMEPTTTIDLMLGDPEMDKVKCPIKGIILRQDCLDYSGTHFDDCQGCEIGKATRDKLLIPRQ